MKFSKKSIQSKTHAIPDIEFKDQQLTSYSGIPLLQLLFNRLDLKNRLNQCFRHLDITPVNYGSGLIVLMLITHLFIGKRKLQDVQYYNNDPMIARLLGLTRLPDVSTISRRLSIMDKVGVEKLRELTQDIVLNRIEEESLSRLTLDFDGTVLSTCRHAEGTAVGFNKKKKGQRSYYPLICTVAQTGQVFDVLHRPGNVHDSNGSVDFILSCINRVKSRFPKIKIEVRMDSAFFNESLLDKLDAKNIEFSVSVPFARLAELKAYIENRLRWRSIDDDLSYFEKRWKPKSWSQCYRFIFVRTVAKCQTKGPIQLDLFTPCDFKHEFKVIVTNKSLKVKKLIPYHNGRGYQENLYSELKSQIQMDYTPCRRLFGNQVYFLATLVVHNLNREMQMICNPTSRGTTEIRSPLWIFEKIETIRCNLIQVAGRITKPNGRMRLTMNANDKVEGRFFSFMDALTS